jgi:hypothetical protein
MPIPALNDDGVLPVGIHDCSLEELEDRFGRFQPTDHRFRLVERFKVFIEYMKGTGLFAAVIVDGSFVTSDEHPNDIDVILVLRSDYQISTPIRAFEYNALSRRWIRREYGFDALIARQGSDVEEYVDFFAQVRKRPDLRKGLLRISL